MIQLHVGDQGVVVSEAKWLRTQTPQSPWQLKEGLHLASE